MSLLRGGRRVLCMHIPALPMRNSSSSTAAHRFGRGAASVALLLVLLPEAPAAGAGSVGLSSLHGRAIANLAVAGDEPESAEQFAAALAVGDFNGDLIDDLATGIPNDDGVADIEQDIGAVLVQFGSLHTGLDGSIAPLLLSQETGPDLSFDNEHFGAALAVGDFDHDFIDDLAVGVPGNVVGGIPTGSVQIYYGSTNPGVFDGGNVLTLSGSASDSIGYALTTGDFNDDNFDDLAIGIPGKASGAGAVFVTYGSAAGLTGGGQYLEQNNADIEDVGEPNDKFGFALAAGDFNANGKSDLVVGVPNENGSGAVQIFLGMSSGLGLDLVNDILWTQNSVAGTSEPNDKFGFALATGDFDDDFRDDLVIGSPGEALGLSNELTDSGSVVVLFGTPSVVPFDLGRTQAWSQGGIIGLETAEMGDRFGEAFAVGDFNRDGRQDLMVAHPQEDLAGTNDGAVTVLLGGATGFVQSLSRVLAAGVEGLPGSVQTSANYGQAAAAGDFNWDFADDLVIGVPFFNAGPLIDTGMQVVLYGSTFSDGFEGLGTAYWSNAVP
jgi:hypothetical protein